MKKLSLILKLSADCICDISKEGCTDVDKQESDNLIQHVFSNGISLSVISLFKQEGQFIINIVHNSLLMSVIFDYSSIFKNGDNVSEEETNEFKEFFITKLISPPRQSELKETSDQRPPQESLSKKRSLKFPSMPDSAPPSSKPAPSGEEPPKFDDEYQMLGSKDDRPMRPMNSNPYSIGDRDLNPPGLPKNPSMTPFVDPLQSGGSEGGMMPTANHPLFNGGDPNYNPLGKLPPRLGGGLGPRYDDPMMGDGSDDLSMIGGGLPGNLRGGRRGGPGNGFGSGGPFGGSSGFGGGFI